MDNPFKPDDKVQTKVKGADVEATVTQVFNNEVQIKTGDGKVLWRTMHTVWYPGASPIPKSEKPKAEAIQEPTPAAPVEPAPVESGPQPDAAPPIESAPSEGTEAPASNETSTAVESTEAPAAVVQPAKNGKRRAPRKPRKK